MAGIDTGGRYADINVQQDNRPSIGSNKILFDSSSTSQTSVLINVQVDYPVMIVAYLMEDGAELTVEGVSVGSRSIANGGGCCTPYDNGRSLAVQDTIDIRFREPMTLGGNLWQITDTKRRLVITLPGQYILQLNYTQYLGLIHVEQVELGKISTKIPDIYMAGVI